MRCSFEEAIKSDKFSIKPYHVMWVESNFQLLEDEARESHRKYGRGVLRIDELLIRGEHGARLKYVEWSGIRARIALEGFDDGSLIGFDPEAQFVLWFTKNDCTVGFTVQQFDKCPGLNRVC